MSEIHTMIYDEKMKKIKLFTDTSILEFDDISAKTQAHQILNNYLIIQKSYLTNDQVDYSQLHKFIESLSDDVIIFFLI